MSGERAGSRGVLAVLCLAQAMVAVDVTVVTVAFPHIQESLRIDATQLQWVSTAYILPFGGFLMLAGRTGDLFGKRRVFRWGIWLFTLASLLCAVCQQGWLLFLARGMQGLGAALVVPSTLALMTTTFPEGAERQRAMAVWSAVASAGAVAGYTLGGTVTGLFGWRWVFLVNVPVGVFCLLRSARLPEPTRLAGRPKLDLPGAVTITSGLVLVVLAITSVGERGFSTLAWISLMAGIVLLTAFAFIERRHPQPLVRFGIFANRDVLAGNLINITNAAAPAVIVFFTSLYLQKILGFTPVETGLSFAPITLLGAVLARLSGPLMTRFGPRVLIFGGATSAAVGAAWLSRTPVDGLYFVDVLPGILLTSLGAMVAFAPSMIVATSGVDPSEQGLASGLVSTSQQIGSALGLAVFATLATSGTDTGDRADFLGGLHLGYYGAVCLPILTIITTVTLTRKQAEKPKQRDESTA
jgi:EmrB/QacA subfamily drug resistance transporter